MPACVVTDVVVAGSPGMTVDGLRQLHLEQSHFFSEQAPGDAIAELGVFGAAPASPKFGGTRMSTNAPDHPPVAAHSRYFEPGSAALENMADVRWDLADLVAGRAVVLEDQRAGVERVEDFEQPKKVLPLARNARNSNL